MKKNTRTLLAPAFLLLAALVLAACGGGGADDTASGSSGETADGPTSTTVEQDASAFPVTIEHMLGEATIETPPKRVLALGIADQDIALALGITPVGMIANPYADDGLFPWVRGSYDLEGVELVPLELEKAPIEKLVALKPDVILATSAAGTEELYDRYSKLDVPIIAPIKGPVADSWQDRTRVIGNALGRAEAADDLIADTEATIGQVSTDLPGLDGKSFTLGNAVSSNQVRAVNRSTDSAAQLFDELGMVIAPGLTTVANDTIVGAVDVSGENFDRLDADAIFLAGSDGAVEGVENSALFSRLDAVAKNDTYVHYDGTIGYGLRVPSPLSVPYVLDELRPTLERTAALDG